MDKQKVSANVFGIPSELGPGKVQRAVRTVLAQIKARYPRDFKRITRRVKAIRRVSKSEYQDGTLGEWKADGGCGDYESAGVILLANDLSHTIATVAHEFGHACTRGADCEKRDIDSEWASEMSADYYAHKWGFGRSIERRRPHLDFIHHGPAPSHYFTFHANTMGPEDVWCRWWISKSFIPELVQTETQDGRLIETAEQIKKRKRLRNIERSKNLPPLSPRVRRSMGYRRR